MAEILAPADAEAQVVADLDAQYAARSLSATVGTKIRDPRTDTFTKVILAGGDEGYFSTDPMLILECWAPTETAAWDLCSVTVALVNSLPDRLGICSGVDHVGGPANEPDPDSNTPRYVFTKVLHLRKHAI